MAPPRRRDGALPLRTGCAADAGILFDGPRYHLAWLNLDYSPTFVKSWTDGGCLDRVSASLGYRLQLDALRHPVETQAGVAVTFEVDLRDVGWARVHSARRLEVVAARGQAWDVPTFRFSSGTSITVR